MSCALSGSLNDMIDPTAPTPAPELVDVEAVTTAVVAEVVETSRLAEFFDRSFPAVGAAVGDAGATITGPAFALYRGPMVETADLEVGFPTDREVSGPDPVRRGSLPGGRAARLVHHGGYDSLGTSWERLRSWIEEQGLVAGLEMWEVYVTEPSPDMDPADLRTELYWPLL